MNGGHDENIESVIRVNFKVQFFTEGVMCNTPLTQESYQRIIYQNSRQID